MSARRGATPAFWGGVTALLATLSSAPAAFDRNGEVRDVVAAPSGTLVAEVRWVVDKVTAADALRGRIEYRPDGDPRHCCENIRFVQVARVQKNGGQDYDWQMGEADRNRQRTPAAERYGVMGGYFVDHRAAGCAYGEPCSPYFRDSWANPDESQDGFQRGDERESASLVDYPYGWDAIERISLESCARCVDTGAFLACAQWGAAWPAQGPRDIAPVRITARPSMTFLAALRRFDSFYGPSPLAFGPARPSR
jgi:hypothetical protein